MSKITRRSLVAAGLALPFVARHGFAQSDWPKGPVRWVVAFAAGGAADTVARNIAVRAGEILNQQVIIENRTGGNAVVAANFVLQAPRDGQTFHHQVPNDPLDRGRAHVESMLKLPYARKSIADPPGHADTPECRFQTATLIYDHIE